MSSYYLWTIGCQMNTADSQRLASALEHVGLSSADKPSEADVVVLNSCVVRQSAEDKVVGTLGLMKSVKGRRQGQVLALMGCMVGAQTRELEARFPYVDVFMRPQEFDPLLRLLEERFGMSTEGCLSNQIPQSPGVSGYVPVIHGCDLMCTFCVIPFRRGRQVSRSMEELVREVGLMARRGMREVTLLGQTVDAYGHDLEEKVDLADLLREVALVPELARVRFLTSHPIFMTDRIIETVRDIDKVCEHINLPVQAADDEILDAMRRRYSEDEYRRIIERIRGLVPNVAISTDVIVGFPGETRDQFNRTLDLVRDIEFHKVHTAVYSPRPGTYALRRLPDDVSPEEKEDRFRALEEVQRGIQERNNAALLGATLEVLVDGKKKGRWKGRTLSDKLVFFEDDRDLLGELVDVKIVRTSPWSLGGEVVDLLTLQKAGVP
jgi:tRNA-2-methylthio-N6-dimethylallyladenosine synthase